ncbi:AAA family ATPase [Aromatoleum petrolei]|uniref:AAA domain-containing protein n=1 Tax=Aromatoleum petrolei TaxID=76116 RepID=A0ABX1MRX7_9RHOO|nr:AAA family ATPase [Aromatoleum petrolei]NMF90737.1 AAA domain-containing protein [Aromatoleum petrolei]QTQ38402.1 AAA family ATPase [Aromatoleum petrolei]
MPVDRPSVPDLHDRLAGLVAALERGLVERSHVVRLVLLAALAGEHTLLIGPPGTAKSELARRLHLAFRDGRYFERLLTRFSVPEELFGPLSIQALEQDRYERHTAGFLPDASIAFIDEVFKANSAILNALLTLLNEREFDNGAGRQRCPLISAIGATNEVPEDEVAEAFFDRFLLRVTVVPVSAEGFAALLGGDPSRAWQAPASVEALGADDLAALDAAAGQVALPAEVTAMFAELRAHLRAAQVYVSDRRWVKAARLLRIAAASEGRRAVSLWDLLLLPWCTAPDAPRQAALCDWLCARLGVREAFAPPRVTRIVEAFEAQLQAERNANDLDYDESGRLRFSATDLADEIGDAKGGAQALRLTHTRQRRYGPAHIGARTRQIDELVLRLDAYVAELDALRRDLADYRVRSLWPDAALAGRADESLAGTARVLADLRERIVDARTGFESLPRLPAGEGGEVPAPVAHEPLPAA